MARVIGGIVDLHNHLIPGVDDGASDEKDSRAGLAAFAAAGVARVATTPHVQGSLTLRPQAIGERLEELDAGWERLQVVARTFPQLEVLRAAEVMLDAPQVDLSDPRLRIAGGRYALVEFPFLTVPPHSAHALAGIVAGGVIPVLAHPERYAGLDARLALAEDWVAAGAVLQVNGPSLAGKYGGEARAFADALLARGLVHYIGSDFHARGSDLIANYTGRLAEAASEEQLRLLLVTNPARILAGEPPIPVGPVVRRKGFWSRVFAR